MGGGGGGADLKVNSSEWVGVYSLGSGGCSFGFLYQFWCILSQISESDAHQSMIKCST